MNRMSDVVITFEREHLTGIVAVGVSVMAAMRRFGVKLDDGFADGVHTCSVIITSGTDNLSPLTKTETEHFKVNGRRSNERLACEARIIKSGEVSIMTEEQKKQTKANGAKKDPLEAEFEALPLDKKIASLLRMEAVTLSETINYVVSSSMKAVEKAGDVIQDFGTKIDKEMRKGSCSPENKASAESSATGAAKNKSAGDASRAKSGQKTRATKRRPKPSNPQG
jgi:ferredoxin